MEVTDEELIAYLDGEVSEREKLRLEQLIASNPGLKHRLATFQELDNQITDAHQSIEELPYPPEILKMLSQAGMKEQGRGKSPVGVQLSSWARLNTFITRAFSGSAWISFAATASALAIGILLGSQLFPSASTSSRSLAELAGLITSENPLYPVLEYSLANEVSQIDIGQNTSAMPVLTFRTVDARYCREFTVSTTQQGARGIACRERDEWSLELMVRDDSVTFEDGQYVPASGSNTTALDDLFNSLTNEAPMDGSSEARLIQNGWNE